MIMTMMIFKKAVWKSIMMVLMKMNMKMTWISTHTFNSAPPSQTAPSWGWFSLHHNLVHPLDYHFHHHNNLVHHLNLIIIFIILIIWCILLIINKWALSTLPLWPSYPMLKVLHLGDWIQWAPFVPWEFIVNDDEHRIETTFVATCGICNEIEHQF